MTWKKKLLKNFEASYEYKSPMTEYNVTNMLHCSPGNKV